MTEEQPQMTLKEAQDRIDKFMEERRHIEMENDPDGFHWSPRLAKIRRAVRKFCGEDE